MKYFCSLAVAASFATLLLAGCRIVSNKNGKNENVDISTPFGSMHVKSNDKADSTNLGLATYPGAVPVKDDKDDNNSADLNMNFGDFHMGLKVISYQTSDSPDKVLAFYRKDMARYGDVIECQNNEPVGTPTRTSQGLTCQDQDDKENTHIHASASSDDDLQLRAGSEQRQHIVGVKKKDGTTRIGLVMLNLPSQLHSHDSNDSKEPE
jgi:hypothetical protein